jgi:hypothetical protein
MRLGRVLRASKRHTEALATYAELAALGDVAVVGLPGELVARSARIELLPDVGQHQAAREEATALGEQLARGRWKLTSGQYEYYLDLAAAGAGRTVEIGRENLATARAAADLWLAWKGGLPPIGRRSMQAGGMALLAAWRSGADRIAFWIVPADQLLTPLPADPHTAIALSDPAGVAVAGVLDGPVARRCVQPLIPVCPGRCTPARRQTARVDPA